MNLDLPRKTVEDLEGIMLQMEQADCPITHHFGPGLYVREMRMKAGTFVIGHSHNQDDLNIFISGQK